jgi:hypothetical protein
MHHLRGGHLVFVLTVAEIKANVSFDTVMRLRGDGAHQKED